MHTTTTHPTHECDTCRRLARNAHRCARRSPRPLVLVADRCGDHEVELAAA